MNHSGGLRCVDVRPTGEHRGRKMPLWILFLYLINSVFFPKLICFVCFDTFLTFRKKRSLLCTWFSEGWHCPLSPYYFGCQRGRATCLGLDMWHVFHRKDLVSPLACCLLLLSPWLPSLIGSCLRSLYGTSELRAFGPSWQRQCKSWAVFRCLGWHPKKTEDARK